MWLKRITTAGEVGWREARTIFDAKIPPRTRRTSTAVAGSLLLHCAILGLLLWSPTAKLKGVADGQAVGIDSFINGENLTPIDLVTVSPPAKSSPAPAPSHDAPAPPSTDGETATPEQAKPEALADNSISEVSDSEVDEPSVDSEAKSLALNEATSEPSAAAAQLGATNGNTNLLEQIARCLPPNERPVLPGVTISLSFNDQGNLGAVPTIAMDLSAASDEDIREANLVVQAVLQCGPYTAPVASISHFDVPVDFSTENGDE